MQPRSGGAIPRRTFLRGAAAAGLGGTGALLAACGRSSPAASSTTTTGAAGPTTRFRAGDRPFPSRAAGTDMLPEIRHIVVLMMENHSFDNYFGMLGRGDGFDLDARGRPRNANPGPDGTPVVAYPARSVCQADAHVSQDWAVSHQSWNHGRNDGFVRAKGTDPMAYFTGADLPFYYSLGRTFPLCDRWFASTMAQTDPNRRFLIAGSAFGLVDDSFPVSATRSNRPGGFGTVFDMLDHFGIPWLDYYSSLPTALLFPYAAAAVAPNLEKIDHFFSDAAAGTLPGFCLVEPDFGTASEENPQDVQNGQAFAASVVNAVMAGPAWPDTVLIWVYDEHGGYYDHVPPQRAVPPDDIAPDVPAAELDGDHYSWTGFRVPAVVVSPWAKRDYVSHVVHDHTSILRLLETKWNLPALSNRDANASNLLDTLDLTARRPPFLSPPTLAAAQAVSADQVAACAALNQGG
ncbi:MAG TPA: alkaline phosphatase family protein [Acidimicrobiales bacterium]|nr:alkaline phosphatase family protein [Acidimicrobiales bacterium]